MLGLQPGDKRAYHDSCASIGIWKDKEMLVNVQTIPGVRLQGVTGIRLITQMGDVTWLAKGSDGSIHTQTITDVMYDPESPVKLVSVSQVSEAGGKSHFEKGDNFVSFDTSEGGEIQLELEKVNHIYAFVNTHEESDEKSEAGPLIEDIDEDDEVWHEDVMFGNCKTATEGPAVTAKPSAKKYSKPPSAAKRAYCSIPKESVPETGPRMTWTGKVDADGRPDGKRLAVHEIDGGRAPRPMSPLRGPSHQNPSSRANST